MRRVLLTLLAIIVVFGLFAAAGYAGYRMGYAQGLQSTANGNAPQLRPFDDMRPRGMPNFGFDRGFHRGFGMGGFPMMGFGLFAPLFWLGRLVVLGLVLWFLYWLFTRSGWRLTRETVTTTPTQTETVTETKIENE